MTSLFWLIVAGAMWYYGDIWRVVTTDPRPYQLPLFLAKASVVVLFACIAYLVLYPTIVSTFIPITRFPSRVASSRQCVVTYSCAQIRISHCNMKPNWL